MLRDMEESCKLNMKHVVGVEKVALNECKRIFSLKFDFTKLSKFFKNVSSISVRDLEFIPYYRFLIANELNQTFGGELQDLLKNILNDCESGAFVISIQTVVETKDDYLKFSTALSHLIGLPNIDLLSGKFYATFMIENDNNAPINLLRPYENFKMHTDGAFMLEPTDWILFMKMQEENVEGGKTRLLHMKDWNEFEYFYNHKVASKSFKFAGPTSSDKRSEAWGNHRKAESLMAPILEINNQKRTIRFVDQFIHPESIEDAVFISELQSSLDESVNLVELDLPAGSILMINNHIWTHGRSKFQSNPDLKRELMRQRGRFYNDK